MNPFGIGVPELILIFVIALLVFGPRRLPEIGKNIGKALTSFKRATSDLQQTIDKEMRMEELKDIKEELSTSASELVDTVYPPEESQEPPASDGKQEREQE